SYDFSTTHSTIPISFMFNWLSLGLYPRSYIPEDEAR
ncbi:MAG: hypothetical protein ACI9S9_002565, partial [Planctomycetota bacterium]